VTLDQNQDSGVVPSGGVAFPPSVPRPEKSADNAARDDLLRRCHRRPARSVTIAAAEEFKLTLLISAQKAKVLGDLDCAFPCVPENETFRSVLDNKT